MKMRLKFQCWNCNREYTMIREIEGRPQLIVACPYCLQEGVVDLNPYRDSTTPIFQGEDAAPDAALPTYVFPPLIPTAAPIAPDPDQPQ